ncbi:MAG: endopeptidase La [Planctomycetaceae bacterium]
MMNEFNKLPMLAVRNVVFFPFTLAPLLVGRIASVAAAEASLKREDKLIVIFSQKDPAAENPTADDVELFGTKAVIKRAVRGDDGLQLIVQGLERVERVGVEQTEPYVKLSVKSAVVPAETGTEVEALQRAVLAQAKRIQELAQATVGIDFDEVVEQLDSPMQLVYLIASFAGLSPDQAQELLVAGTHLESLKLLHGFLEHELEVLELQTKIATAAKSEMTREQREYLLRQQMRVIQEELGQGDGESAEVDELRTRFEESNLPDEVHREAQRLLNRLEALSPSAPDFQVARTHLELVLELPWNKLSVDALDLAHARKILDEDHFGLEEIKDRILEHLAVMKLNPQAHAPILCFVGPPGVGKTSLGKSIARSLGRQFERLSLGGMSDEAELRGHRRTYIGAMPGRIIQAVRRAEVRNPVVMLDEIDKLGQSYKGDPAAALLEILDPAQNDTFRDNYLDLPFDLSRVFFIVTANTLDTIPRPLLDRMEIIQLSGYTDEEKLEIAKRYLIPRQLQEAGLKDAQLKIPDATILSVIGGYTREAGVRELERRLGQIARKVAFRVATEVKSKPTIKSDQLDDLLGPQRFFQEQARRNLDPGVATGLAWTEAGGDVLYIEAIRLPDGERLRLTGQLGSVMQESAQAALSYVLAHQKQLCIEDTTGGIHLHVPAGAVPKDGPSAGVTMATALTSVLTGQVIRSDTAMTGEITLSGLVLPVGGIKEKVLAARRAGLKRVILPRENQKDIDQIPAQVRGELEILFADRIEDVLVAAIPTLEGCLSSLRSKKRRGSTSTAPSAHAAPK